MLIELFQGIFVKLSTLVIFKCLQEAPVKWQPVDHHMPDVKMHMLCPRLGSLPHSWGLFNFTGWGKIVWVGLLSFGHFWAIWAISTIMVTAKVWEYQTVGEGAMHMMQSVVLLWWTKYYITVFSFMSESWCLHKMEKNLLSIRLMEENTKNIYMTQERR